MGFTFLARLKSVGTLDHMTHTMTTPDHLDTSVMAYISKRLCY